MNEKHHPIQERAGYQNMLKTGTKIMMTKGYRGVEGFIKKRTDSRFEFYVISLQNGINIIVGPSAFVIKEEVNDKEKA